jgi:flagellar P-ring protein precursor FlgI
MLNLALALLALLAPQEPGVPPVQVWTSGGVEAPDQPTGRSRAEFERTPRFQPQGADVAARRISAPVGSLVEVRGQEDNMVIGVGLVTGLAGTGDSTNMVRQVLQNLLIASNIKIDAQQLTAKNVALVRVEAMLPPGIQPGRRIDARVSTLGDAKSLQGGTLALVELTDLSGTVVYATAGGPVNVGGFLAGGEAATTSKNHVTVGTVPGGAKVERGVPSHIVSQHGWIYLDARAPHASYSNIVRIVDAVNALYPEAAVAATDGRTVKVRVPSDLPESAWMAYLDTILRREVEPASFAKVVINERTGTIVMGEGLRLRPGAVAHGALTVTVAESAEASQPGAFSGGQTERLGRTEVTATEEDNGLVYVPGAVTLQEVVEVLNVLGATPRELIGIIEGMSQAGLLMAEIERL